MVIGICEGVFYLWVTLVNKKFGWLITTKDKTPKLSKEGLEKFFAIGYDTELGWIRKPNTANSEKKEKEITTWSINNYGCRTNPGFDTHESRISCYGDSFTFCRQTNNDETWEYFLSKLQKTNVLNFGVGNYGVDQAILRLKREFPKHETDIVILGVVPDTISRIMSMWKHYYEYGNTFGFKPRYKIKNKKLHLIKNKIDIKEKFFYYEKYLEEIQKDDIFYQKKFKNEIIKFPYLYNIFKNYKRNIPILFWVTLICILKIFKASYEKYEWNPMKIIMHINLKWRIKLFKNQDSSQLLEKLLEEFAKIGIENKFKPIFLLLPQKDDILFIKKNYNFYKQFVNNISKIKNLHVIDFTNELLNEIKLDEQYSDHNEYGGHYSKKGNQKLAFFINDELLKIIQKSS
jgi:hypothetical protein